MKADFTSGYLCNIPKQRYASARSLCCNNTTLLTREFQLIWGNSCPTLVNCVVQTTVPTWRVTAGRICGADRRYAGVIWKCGSALLFTRYLGVRGGSTVNIPNRHITLSTSTHRMTRTPRGSLCCVNLHIYVEPRLTNHSARKPDPQIRPAPQIHPTRKVVLFNVNYRRPLLGGNFSGGFIIVV